MSPPLNPAGPDRGRRPGPEPPATVGLRGMRKAPRGVHPEVWRLSETLLAARGRLPYASAEARLLDGVQRFVALECRAPVDGVSLTPTGPRWGAVLQLVRAAAALASDDSRGMLAPWVGVAPGVPGQGAVGVSPHAAAAAAFVWPATAGLGGGVGTTTVSHSGGHSGGGVGP